MKKTLLPSKSNCKKKYRKYYGRKCFCALYQHLIEDLKDMYNWVKPKSVIPVHGEHRHMKEHVLFAKEMKIASSLLVENGDIIKLLPGEKPVIIDKAPFVKMYLDGDVGVGKDSSSIKERKNISINGYLEINIIINSTKLKKLNFIN